jgi:hypothetical protein
MMIIGGGEERKRRKHENTKTYEPNTAQSTTAACATGTRVCLAEHRAKTRAEGARRNVLVFTLEEVSIMSVMSTASTYVGGTRESTATRSRPWASRSALGCAV